MIQPRADSSGRKTARVLATCSQGGRAGPGAATVGVTVGTVTLRAADAP